MLQVVRMFPKNPHQSNVVMSKFMPCTGQHEWWPKSCIIREYIQRSMTSKKSKNSWPSKAPTRCQSQQPPEKPFSVAAFRWWWVFMGNLNSGRLAWDFFKKSMNIIFKNHTLPQKLTAKAPGYRRSGPKRKETHLPTNDFQGRFDSFRGSNLFNPITN